MIIDTPTNIRDMVSRFKAAGVTTIIRYESRLPKAGWKRWQPDEVRAITDAGLHLGIVYEDDGHPRGYDDGYEAATWALNRREARGQPDGSAIYYAVDYDVGVDNINNAVVPYFHGVNKAHAELGPKIKIGCYGSGLVNRTLLALKLIDLRWITCSMGFNGSREAVRNNEYDLWQTHCETSLLHIDVDYNSARIDDFGQFLPWGTITFTSLPVAFASSLESPEIAFNRGRGSVYSWFTGKYVWKDSGDAPNSNALMVPDDCQGVSFYDHHTLGKWFEIRAPNGNTSLEQQTDIGPAPWTGRGIDISAVCAERLGYSPFNFPTNGVFYWRLAATPTQVAELSPRQQAKKWLQIRQA
jgi:Domain of unknown function (DUF1906)